MAELDGGAGHAQVEGDVLKCLGLDIQDGELETRTERVDHDPRRGFREAIETDNHGHYHGVAEAALVLVIKSGDQVSGEELLYAWVDSPSVNGQGWVARVLWGLVCAFVGSLTSVVLAIIVVFATPFFHIKWPFSHGLVLLIVIGVPILIGALLGFAFPRQAQDTSSGATRGLANAYGKSARPRR